MSQLSLCRAYIPAETPRWVADDLVVFLHRLKYEVRCILECVP